MFLHRSARLAAAVATSLVVVAALAVAQATFTPYKANDVPVAVTDPGVTTFPDSQMHIRGFKFAYTRKALPGDTLDPRVSGGTLVYVMNFNLGASKSGPIWGTGHWEIGDGSWDGTFEGSTNVATHVGYFDAVWHGGGAFLGLQLKESCVYTGRLVGTCTGRILQTPRN